MSYFTIITMALCFGTLAVADASPPAPPKPSTSDILATSPKSDWRVVDPKNTIYMELPAGRVIIELAPDFAPKHVQNIKTLLKAKYWDGLQIVRVQDNYVAQWGDPHAEDPKAKKSMGSAKLTLAPEFDRAISTKIPFTKLMDPDTYAPEVGFSNGFPVARDGTSQKTWLTHCYGAVGAGRNTPVDSGSGAELYAVIGHSPRHLDRNVTLVGRVVKGIELLSALPRGSGPLGFYEKPEERMTIRSVRLASDLPVRERLSLEALKTDSKTFEKLIEARRFRSEEWFHHPAGHLEVCNMMLPVREHK